MGNGPARGLPPGPGEAELPSSGFGGQRAGAEIRHRHDSGPHPLLAAKSDDLLLLSVPWSPHRDGTWRSHRWSGAVKPPMPSRETCGLSGGGPPRHKVGIPAHTHPALRPAGKHTHTCMHEHVHTHTPSAAPCTCPRIWERLHASRRTQGAHACPLHGSHNRVPESLSPQVHLRAALLSWMPASGLDVSPESAVGPRVYSFRGKGAG